jgi:RNA polymerase sigma factor (sigma-70 family)
MTDQKAFAGLQQKDPAAMKWVFETYRRPFLAWAPYALSCSPQDAEDLYDESLITLFHNAATGNLTVLSAKLKTYLFAIGKNKWRSLETRRRREQLLPPSDAVEPEESDVEANEERVRVALAQMEHPCKTMLEMRYYLDISFEDIAEALSYRSGDVVRNLMTRCRKKLRELYSKPDNNK